MLHPVFRKELTLLILASKPEVLGGTMRARCAATRSPGDADVVDSALGVPGGVFLPVSAFLKCTQI
jgi:hypothetical protein